LEGLQEISTYNKRHDEHADGEAQRNLLCDEEAIKGAEQDRNQYLAEGSSLLQSLSREEVGIQSAGGNGTRPAIQHQGK